MLRISLILTLVIGSAFYSQAQEVLAAGSTSNSLKSALFELEKEYAVRFSYDPNEIKGIRVPQLTSRGSIETDLRQLLQSTNLEFERVEGQYFVIKKAASKFIRFQVDDAETGTPLPYATIRQQSTSMGIVTDENGIARLVMANPKGVVLDVLYLGFQKFAINLDSIDSKASLKIGMKPEPLDLNDYEVKEYLNAGIAADPKANSFKILPQEMEILPGLSERDVLLSAQIISGV
ncbi:MAG: hypothetical protein HWE07_09585, partial [Cytophagia bacterium]|nr:hypothetical protein [Cytophagia bacterium]